MATISISTQLYPFFDTKAAEGAADAAYGHAMRVYGANVAAAMTMWLDNLQHTSKTLDPHPDGVTRFDVCAISGVLQECEICEIWDVAKAYEPCFAVFRGADYHTPEEAKAEGALYTLPLLGAVDSIVILNMAQVFDTMQGALNTGDPVAGFIIKNGQFVPLPEVLVLARAGNDPAIRKLLGVAA